MSKFPKPTKRRKKPIKIDKILRESVAKRDNYTCQLNLDGCSGNAEQQHHILYRSYQGANIAQNLICVCNSCHLAIHSNGKKWFPILLKLQQRHYPEITKEDLKR